MSIFALTPQIAIGDDQFLADFLESKTMKCSEETVLRLDNSSITTNGFYRAIEVSNFFFTQKKVSVTVSNQNLVT